MDDNRPRLPVRLIATTFSSAVQVTAAFAPFPWMGAAAGALAGIVQVCQSVSTNRQALRQLGHRAEVMLITLRDNQGDMQNAKLHECVDLCTATLSNIHQKMFAWSQLKSFRALLLHDDIVKGISEAHQAITDCSSHFMLLSHLEIHSWQDEFQRNVKEDHEEILEGIAGIRNQQEMAQVMLAEQNQKINQILSMLQNGMGQFPVGDWRHQGLAQGLYSITQTCGKLLPELHLQVGEVRRTSSYAVGGSPAFDIWEGSYLEKEKVAIKVIRGIDVTENTIRRFRREVEIWRTIWEKDRGTYILPFYGLCTNDGPHPYMVSPWMKNGDAVKYLKDQPDVNRKFLVHRIAEAVRFLHNQNPPIAHGDLKALNVLINDDGYPLLADFGLSRMMEDVTGVPFTQSRGISESYRWFAPELCCSPGIISLASDIFAFSMTALEIMTGEQPFAHIKRTPEVLVKMQIGERPHRPVGQVYVDRGLDDKFWSLLQRCWVREPNERPTIHAVLKELPLA